MRKMKALVALGTRPEVIKLAPVIMEMRRRPGRFRPILAATGQHGFLQKQMLQAFGLEPDFELRVMRSDQSLEALTGRVLRRFSALLETTRPDLVMVQGDTTTAMACGLSAFYRRIPVAHVEAGLRTDDVYRPFPEEVNRRIITQVASHHFAPTRGAAANLLRQGVPRGRVLVTGNTVVDAVRWAAKNVSAAIPARVERSLARKPKLILVTVHRRESFGRPLLQICRALRAIAQNHPEALLVYPVHPNPNVRRRVQDRLDGVERIVLTRPLDYFAFLSLLKRAHLVLTDSGGVQEEAPSFRVPVLVLREVTERPEGVASGVAKVVGLDAGAIVRETGRLLQDRRAHDRMRRPANPYGDGRAARRIVEYLARRTVS
ncbi:MAG: UDP-N-acetylglucosamine 2-epimerase (non-hydrolyzing) [Candidatus Aminicenantes bacterium]|nr:UDP-N-acetylglucosamine 2-epimerase (non-hydrolyzing) [Candidatus Aminicenantes bacterium]